MEYQWRLALREQIEDRYIEGPEAWFDLNISSSGMLNLTIVSDRFENIPLEERREQIHQLLRQFNAPSATGFLSLYTPDEAEAIHLPRPSNTEENSVYSWLDLVQQAANASESPKTTRREIRIPHTVTFYSFKGGVGRTTALTHVAAILAMRGRRVVAVDLDLEAPGLSSALKLTPSPEHGIVDYFYERAYLPEGVEPGISVAEIFGEVRIPDATGRLFVVPAGILNLGYIAKVDDLRASTITESGKDLWSTFYDEITEQLQPDIILVDSRTGINEWGAFSLLRAADKAIVFLYPNEQNRRGIGLLLEALASTVSISFVFSPVPSLGDIGMKMVRKQWKELRNIAGELPSESQTEREIANPIVIPYNPGIALAETYPVSEFLSYYTRIADVIEEETNALRLRTILANQQYRREILESLRFSQADAQNNPNFINLFQRTADFDKLLDRSTDLIRGRKGTGKSTLYWLLLKHKSVVDDLTFGKTKRIQLISGHGAFRPDPTVNDFQHIDQHIKEHQGSWEAFWRYYLIVRMYMENLLQQQLQTSQYKPLRAILSNIPGNASQWGAIHLSAIMEMMSNATSDELAKKILKDMHTQQRKESQTLWVLYDDLEKSFKGELREKTLIGLFQLVQNCIRELPTIRFKIFLSEDVWNMLTFENKSYFNGRNLLLQWTLTDFLRLALRQAMQSTKFKEVVDSFAPVANIDQASIEELNEALQLLWGNRWDPRPDFSDITEWLYYRLGDASESVFPRSLIITLREATKLELSGSGQLPPPADRLLSLKSLHQGLVRASYERCNEIREEYPTLQPFFDFLINKEAGISVEDLQKLWRETLQANFPELKDFQQFVSFLRSIGLLRGMRFSRSGGEFIEIETDYVYLGNIYLYGFGLKPNSYAEP
jgi:cellulose biosynthesis protein BcsQ